MKILIDSREQAPLVFPIDGICTETKLATLDVGDYQAEYTDGTRPPVVFERKGLGDLFGTMTAGYARFKREMERAQEQGIRLILLIEGTLTDVYAGHTYSQFAGSSCVQKLFTLWVKYDLYPVFCANRSEMSRYIIEFYAGIGRNYKRASALHIPNDYGHASANG